MHWNCIKGKLNYSAANVKEMLINGGCNNPHPDYSVFP